MTALSYAVDLALAASVLETLSAVHGSLEDVIGDLEWRMSHLHGSWSGRSADAHLVSHQEFAASYAEMCAALADMRGALHRAHASYSAAHEATVQLWRSVS